MGRGEEGVCDGGEGLNRSELEIGANVTVKYAVTWCVVVRIGVDRDVVG